jgi:hypothetical protein
MMLTIQDAHGVRQDVREIVLLLLQALSASAGAGAGLKYYVTEIWRYLLTDSLAKPGECGILKITGVHIAGCRHL